MVDRLLASLIFGPVNQQQSTLFVVAILRGELGGKLGNEQAEDVVVCVHLGERAVELALGAYRHLNGNTRVDLVVWAGVDLASHAPLAPGEVEVVDPALVQVQDAHATLELA